MDTPIADSNNLSYNSKGKENFSQFCYLLGCKLDKIVPLKGLTNAQRIEIAINKLREANQ